MYTNQKTNSSKSAVENSTLTLLEELSDTAAEKLCGGAITTPEATAKNQPSATPVKIDNSITQSPDKLQELGLVPFSPPLPETKLPRLGPIDPANRTPMKPQNAITVTIPIPLPVS